MNKHFVSIFCAGCLLVLACGKMDESPVFVINAIFPNTGFGLSAQLVIVDSEGNLVSTIGVGPFQSSLTEAINLGNSEKLVDAHLVVIDSFAFPAPKYYIFSHLQIKNGETTSFYPFARNRVASSKLQQIRVDGLNMTPYPQCGTPFNDINSYDIDATDGSLWASCLLYFDQDMLINLQANGEPEPRSFLLRNTGADTNRLTWTDFKQREHFVPIQPRPGDENNALVTVAAVSQNAERYCYLRNAGNEYPNFDGSTAGFYKPDGLYVGQQFAVTVRTNKGYYTSMFEDGQEIAFPTSNLEMQSVTFEDGRLTLIEKGKNADLMFVKGRLDNFIFFLSGASDAFDHYALPDLEPVVHTPFPGAAILSHGTAGLIRSEKHSHEQVQAGFPLRSTELFTANRCNYEELWVEY